MDVLRTSAECGGDRLSAFAGRSPLSYLSHLIFGKRDRIAIQAAGILAVFLVCPPLQIRESVVERVSVKVAALIPIGSMSDECFQNDSVEKAVVSLPITPQMKPKVGPSCGAFSVDSWDEFLPYVADGWTAKARPYASVVSDPVAWKSFDAFECDAGVDRNHCYLRVGRIAQQDTLPTAAWHLR